MVLAALLSKLRWLGQHTTQTEIGSWLGRSRQSISDYMRGVTRLPSALYYPLEQSYYRLTYGLARNVGYSRAGARRLAGIAPETLEVHFQKARATLDIWAEGKAAQIARREGLDFSRMSESEIKRLYERAYVEKQAEIRHSRIDWQELEERY